MNKIIFVLIYCLPSILWSQPTSFTVRSGSTGEALYLAYIENSTQETLANTDESGKAQLRTHKGDTIKISYVGYKDSILVIDVVASQINISLRTQELETIIVFSKESNHKRAAQGYSDIPLEFLISVPSITGDADIMKTITFLPGVTEGREGYAHLFVRGGDQDQNLILYDNASLFNVNHIGGIISMFNSDMVSAVDFYKSYWPSQFGGRLSSVMNIHSAQGNFKEHQQIIDIGVIYTKAKVTGPLWKDKVSYNFGARRSMIDLVTGPIWRKAKRERNGSMTNFIIKDINGRIDARLNQQHHVALSGIYSKDDRDYYENKSNKVAEEITDIKNIAVALNYSYYLSPKTTLKAHVSYSDYFHQYENTYLDSFNLTKNIQGIDPIENILFKYQNLGSSIQSQKILMTGQTHWSSKLNLNYGFDLDKRKYGIFVERYETEEIEDERSTNFSLSKEIIKNDVFTTSIFTDLEYSLTRRWNIKTGLRLPYYQNHSLSKILPEPKLLTTFHVNKTTSLNAGYNMQQQSLLLIGYTNAEGGYREFYTTADNQIPTSLSHQWSVGYFKSLNNWIDQLNLELFYKFQNNLSKFIPTVDEEQSIANYSDYFHTQGKNNSYGMEVMMQKTKGNLHGSVAYTYAHSTSYFPTLNGGRSFAADFDYRHNLNILLIWKFRKDYKLSGQWTYKSGRPFTLPESVVTGNELTGTIYPLVAELNNYRIPAYHRLDISLDREWLSIRSGKRQWFGLSVYNAYNKINPFYVTPTVDDQLKVYGFLPIIPAFNIGFEL